MRIKVNNGDVFGALTIVEESEKQTLPCGQKVRMFLCRCRCGKEKNLRLLDIRHGRIRSCGCLFRDGRYTKIELDIKKVYRLMVNRCKKDYLQSKYYYDKGISVCDEWSNKSSFLDWALSNGYKKGLQIDRIDNSKGYSPDNCRWVDVTTNVNNRSITAFVEYNGVKYAFMDLLREKGLTNHQWAIRERLNRNWSVEKAFDTPVKKGNYIGNVKHRKKE